ncbi:MAG: hypothetical protein R2729_17630 [Bryobacteraceae bacterium]
MNVDPPGAATVKPSCSHKLDEFRVGHGLGLRQLFVVGKGAYTASAIADEQFAEHERVPRGLR